MEIKEAVNVYRLKYTDSDIMHMMNTDKLKFSAINYL